MAPESGSIVASVMLGRNAMKAPGEFMGLAANSRDVRPGYLFAALAGARADGADFIEDAVQRGAAAVLGRPELAKRAQELGVRFIADDNPRLALARRAAAFFGQQPAQVAAVTGTNGKTSVTVFLRQIWAGLGKRSASLGTIGLVSPGGTVPLKQTTPDPIELHRLLAGLHQEGVEHLAMEASSHGLDQYRLDGVRIAAAGFTNVSRDHLDYHASFEHYLESKIRLFSEVVDRDGVAVLNADSEHCDRFLAAARRRSLRILTVGLRGTDIKLAAQAALGHGQSLEISHCGRTFAVRLPLAGGFQASNALIAAGLAIGLGEDPRAVFSAVETIAGAPGRLERVATAACGAPVFVDYAHTPDALQTVLAALRPHASGRLHVVFGCGGDRDKGKRPLMGAVAARFADNVIVTDDNPRSENAADIRRQVLEGCPAAAEIGDRAEAIRAGIGALQCGDVLVIAGKGHETGQIVGNDVRPFSDREEAIRAALALGGAAA